MVSISKRRADCAPPLIADVRRQMMRLHTLIVGLALLAASCDTVTSQYPDLQAARADHLFERGWLPEILPPSSRDIRTSNDLDLNISTGRFRFNATDFPAFAATLRPYARRDSPLAALDSDLARLGRSGYGAYEYVTGDTIWVFLCNGDQGECEYRMWLLSGSDV